LVNSNVTENGDFTLADLSPGKYDLLISVPGARAYQSSVLFNGREIDGRELDLSQGGGQVNVVLKYGPATVRGIVSGLQTASARNETSSTENTAPRDVTVAFIGDTAPEDLYSIRTIAMDFNGRFGMSNIVPGHYRAYAVEGLDPTRLQNPEFLQALQAKATDVELREYDSKQLQVPLIKAEDMQAIYARSGVDVAQR
jgi:hypothetical protein